MELDPLGMELFKEFVFVVRKAAFGADEKDEGIFVPGFEKRGSRGVNITEERGILKRSFPKFEGWLDQNFG